MAWTRSLYRFVLASGMLAGTLASPQSAEAAIILLDLGASATVSPDGADRHWNNATNLAGAAVGNDLVTDAIATDNTSTTVDIALVAGFTSGNASGTSSSTLRPDDPSTATGDSGYINAGAPDAIIEYRQLIPNASYDITVYGSRGTGTTGRETSATIGSTTLIYNAGGAAGEGQVTFAGVTADVNGDIQISFNAAPGADLGYVGVVEIDGNFLPEPATLGIIGLGAVMMLMRPGRSIKPRR